MGLFSRKEKRKIPTFQVSVFGKLPFYKDFLYSSAHPGFAEFKNHADQCYEQLIRSGIERPYVVPDYGFYLRMNRFKVTLIGRIWESDDGLRGFPFIAAAMFPKGWPKGPLAKAWPCIQAVWDYLDRFGDFLHKLEDPSAFYAQVRGQNHRLEPVIIEPISSTPDEQIQQCYRHYSFGEDLHLDGLQWPEGRLHTLIDHAPFDPIPGLMVWPMTSNWAGLDHAPPGQITFAHKGLVRWEPSLFQTADTNDNAATDPDDTYRMDRSQIQAVIAQSKALENPSHPPAASDATKIEQQPSATNMGNSVEDEVDHHTTARMPVVSLDDDDLPTAIYDEDLNPQDRSPKQPQESTEEDDHDR